LSWLRGLAALGLALAIDGAAFGAWYTASRAYIRDVMGGEAYTFVALLVAAEGLPFILAPFAGFLGDLYGRRRLALLGVLRGPLVPLFALLDPRLALSVVFVYSTLSIVFYTNTLGLLLSAIRGSGRLYGLVTLATPLAYGFGSIVPGLLEPLGGYKLVFVAVGFMEVLAPLPLLLAGGDSMVGGGSRRGLLDPILELGGYVPLGLIAAILLANIASTLYWNMMSIKLYEVTGSLLAFGFIGGLLTTLISTAARPVAGALVDRFNADTVLASTYLAYTVYNIALYYATGVYFMVLWLIPLYPFRETAQVMAISRRVPQSLQATAAGLSSTLWGLASLAYPLAYLAGVDLSTASLGQLLALSFSAILVFYSRRASLP